MVAKSPIVLGVDPGYDRVGWAVGQQTQTRQIEVTQYGCIQTAKTDLITVRYAQVINKLTQVITTHHPTELSLESVFFSKNKTTAMRVAEARGVIMAVAITHGLTVTEYTPPQIKSAITGNGNATKSEVSKMVQLQTNLNLSKEIDDTVDAIAALITHLASRKLRGIS